MKFYLFIYISVNGWLFMFVFGKGILNVLNVHVCGMLFHESEYAGKSSMTWFLVPIGKILIGKVFYKNRIAKLLFFNQHFQTFNFRMRKIVY